MFEKEPPPVDEARKPGEYCMNCQFYGPREGACKRYPQSVSKRPTDWCGEFILVTVPIKEGKK